MHLYSNTYGYHDVFIDKEDIEKIINYPWYVAPKNNSFYIYNNTLGAMHRYLLNITDSNIIIDHIDREPRNNRKSNLRITNHTGNKKNLGLKSNNTSGIIGVYKSSKNAWVAEIKDENHKKIRKSFGCKKYGEENAKKLAIEFRRQKEIEYGYLTNCESSTTIETNNKCNSENENKVK